MTAEPQTTVPAPDKTLRVEGNPLFKAFVALLFLSALLFVFLFFSTSLDQKLPLKLLMRLALLTIPVSAAAFAVFFVAGIAELLRDKRIPRTVLALLALLLIAQCGLKLAAPGKAPYRPSDESEMVRHGRYVWADVRDAYSGEPVLYYPFRPHGHSIILSAASLFAPLTFKYAFMVNIITSTLILLVIFLLAFVLFQRPWQALLCAFLLSVNSIFTIFSMTADYSISALFYSLSADLFIASHLRRGKNKFLIAGMAALVLAVQSRPEYILYPVIIFAYLFLMARPRANRAIIVSSLILLLVVPHFLVTCEYLKNQPVPNYLNDPNIFTASSTFGKILQMMKYNGRFITEWLWKNGTSPFFYIFAAIGVLEGARRYRIQTFILLLPVAVLFFAIMSGNTYSFTTISYSINFQPYLCLLAGVGIFAFSRLPFPAIFKAFIVASFSIVTALSSLSIKRELDRLYHPTEYHPSPVSPALETPCNILELAYLEKISETLDKNIPGIESHRGYLEAATGVRTENLPFGIILNQPKLYFYEALGSSLGDSIAPMRKFELEHLKNKFDFSKVSSKTICGEEVILWSLTKKDENRPFPGQR